MVAEPEEKEPFTFSIAYFMGLFFFMTWINLFPSVLFGYWFFTTFPFKWSLPYLLYLVPLALIVYGIAILTSVITTKIGIWIIHKRIAHPEPAIR